MFYQEELHEHFFVEKLISQEPKLEKKLKNNKKIINNQINVYVIVNKSASNYKPVCFDLLIDEKSSEYLRSHAKIYQSLLWQQPEIKDMHRQLQQVEKMDK